MIPNVVAEAARRFGDRIAYVTERGWPLTYADVDQVSDEVAVGLAREGVGEGDVVALVLPPGPEYLLTYCAAAKLGASKAIYLALRTPELEVPAAGWVPPTDQMPSGEPG